MPLITIESAYFDAVMPGIVEMNVPLELKAIQPYLQRAHEVKIRDAFMAYQCQLYAAQLGYGLLESGGRSGESESFLLGLLDELEAAKHELLEHPAMADDRLASSYILENSLKMFAAADTEDRNGNASKYSIFSQYS
jgi:vacuolar protein sorting-associated protein VTA1